MSKSRHGHHCIFATEPTRIDAARKAGTFDAGVETVVADNLTIAERRPLIEQDDVAITELLTIEAQWAVRCPTVSEITQRAERIGFMARFLRNARSGKVALLTPARSRYTDEGQAMRCHTLHRPSGRQTISQSELEESHWEQCPPDTFSALWQAECDDLVTRPHTERFFLATGRLLPIWNQLGEEAQVRRLVTTDGQSILGRIVPTDTVHPLLQKLGLHGGIQLSPSEIVKAVLDGKHLTINGQKGLTLRRARVNGEHRLEVLGFDPRALPAYKARGAYTEIIAYNTRLFLPIAGAEPIIEALAA